MPICTRCTYPIAYLYTLYQSVNNLRLEQCPECLDFADPYVEHDPLTLFLDLILLKREVYRHLLFNRDCEPRHIGSSTQHNSRDKLQRKHRRSFKLIMQLGASLLMLDASVRWRNATILSFAQVATACMLDTVTYHLSVTLGCVLLLRTLEWYTTFSGCARSVKLGTRAEFRTPLVSLTLFYSSFTKLFLLLLLSIWQSSTTPAPDARASIGAGLPNELSRNQFVLRLLSLLDEGYLDRAWVIRNILGGMSAGFGLRVLLDCHPILTTLVVLFGWMAKSLVGRSITGCTGMSWMSEYPIP